jgi:(4-alkanoyl-5-oxo-2,5-dihydrofuran-3-yl)methyl phosphate reductase
MILISGATGLIGGQVIARLVDEGWPVRAISRHPDTADLPPEVPVLGADLDDPDTLDRVLDGVEHVFAASSGNVVEHDRNLAAAAARVGVRHVVKLSVVGAQDREHAQRTPARMHLAGEEAFQQAGLACTFLRPGTFMSNALGWADSIRAEGVVHTPFARVQAAPIDPVDVAEMAVRSLTGRLPYGGYPLSGPERLSPADQVEQLSAALGRQLKIVEIPDDAMRQNMVRSGLPEELVDGLFQSLEGDDDRRPEAQLFPTVQDALGRPAGTFGEWLTEHLDAFVDPANDRS